MFIAHKCQLRRFHILYSPKNKPTLGNNPSLSEVVAKDTFLSKVHPPIYAAVCKRRD